MEYYITCTFIWKRASTLLYTLLISASLMGGFLGLLNGAQALEVRAQGLAAAPPHSFIAGLPTEVPAQRYASAANHRQTPLANALTIPLTSTIAFTFNESIALASVSSQTFAVYGSRSPIFTGTYTTTAPSQTVTFDPARAFFPGERVDATVTTATLTITGENVTTDTAPRVWQFWAAVQGGTGQFEKDSQVLGNARSQGAALGDIDGDGDLDAFIANHKQAKTVWLNDGMGIFSDSGQPPGDTEDSVDVVLGDLDSDGDLDAYVVNDSRDANTVWLNDDGQGTFNRGPSLGSDKSKAAALGDLDGDGDLDVFVANEEGNNVWFNNGDGNFPIVHTYGISDSRGVALGDVDLDGDLDAFIANYGQPDALWINDGTGSFTSTQRMGGQGKSLAVALGDLDNDGDLDAYIANDGESNEVWINEGSTFVKKEQSLGSERTQAVILGDLDGDGDLDVFEANDGALNRSRLNDGTGYFSSASSVHDISRSYDAALGDLDGDGDLDVFIANDTEDNQVWFNQNRTNLKLEKRRTPSQAAPGDLITYTLTYLNQHATDVVTGTRITDTLPSELTDITYTASGVITPIPGTKYVWRVASLPPGSGGKITITAVLTQDLKKGYIENTARFFGLRDDVNDTDNQANANIRVKNVPPLAVDDHYIMMRNKVLTVTAPGVLENDSDPNDDALRARVGITPTTGTLSLDLDGSFNYTPTEDFGGIITFTYIVSDTEELTDTGKVTLTVNRDPVAVGDYYKTDEETPLDPIEGRNVLSNDKDLDDDALAVTTFYSPSTQGAGVTGTREGLFMYDPRGNLDHVAQDSTVTDTFTYLLADGKGGFDTGTVSITVEGRNDAPVAMPDSYNTKQNETLHVPAPGVLGGLGQDRDVDEGDRLTATLDTHVLSGTLDFWPNGSFIYTPSLDFVGVVTFTYYVNDGWENSNVTTVTINVKLPIDADLAIDKIVSDSNVDEGDIIVYTLRVTNTGGANATGVLVQDQWPPGMNYVADDGQGTYSNTTGVWTIGNLDDGMSTPLHITATVGQGTVRQTITNTAFIKALDQNDPRAANDKAHALITVLNDFIRPRIVGTTPEDGEIGVPVTPQHVRIDFSEAIEQSSFQYAIMPHNPIIFKDWPTPKAVKLVFQYPFEPATTYTVMVKEAEDLEGNALASPYTWTFTTAGEADLALAKDVSNATPGWGSSVVYTLQVKNNGPHATAGVVVSDRLPSGITFDAYTTTHGAYTDTGAAWHIGTLNVSETAYLYITATVDGAVGQRIVNRAVISATNQQDKILDNNAATAALTVTMGNDLLSIAKEAHPSIVLEHDTLVYKVGVINESALDVTDVLIHDALPEGIDYVTATASQGVYTPATGLWAMSALSSGVHAHLYLTATVASGTAGTPITNTAVISRYIGPSDHYTANNHASATVVVTYTTPDLMALDKTVSDATPSQGDAIVYTLQVTNHSDITMPGVVVSDTLPDGLTYITSTATQGTYTPASIGEPAANGLWKVGDMDAMTHATLRITAEVTGTIGTVIVNRAVISDPLPTSDPTPANNQTQAPITLTAALDLALYKAVDNASPIEGTQVVYTLQVTNYGPGDATHVVVSDALPRGVSYVAAKADTSRPYDPKTGLWQVGDIGRGDSAMLFITVTVDTFRASIGWEIINTAHILAVDQNDRNAANDVATATFIMLRPGDVDLAIGKTVSVTTAPAPIPHVVYLPLVLRSTATGDTIQAPGAPMSRWHLNAPSTLYIQPHDLIAYTVHITNSGPATATGVIVTDKLPTALNYVGYTASQGIYATPGLWDVGQLSPAATATLHLTATVKSGMTDITVTNTAIITGVDQVDPIADNDKAQATLIVRETPVEQWTIYLPLVCRKR